jgi:hypothetical protein
VLFTSFAAGLILLQKVSEKNFATCANENGYLEWQSATACLVVTRRISMPVLCCACLP